MARADHIYVNRIGGVYNHHGIDCGDGTVIHYTGRRWQDLRRIERTSLEEFCRGDELEVRDYDGFRATLTDADGAGGIWDDASQRMSRLMDSLRGLQLDSLDFSEEAVIERAESRLGERRFDLMSNNCEHFAAWCKTGISSSAQIDSVWRASLSGPRFMRRQAQHLLTELFEWKPGSGKPGKPGSE